MWARKLLSESAQRIGRSFGKLTRGYESFSDDTTGKLRSGLEKIETKDVQGGDQAARLIGDTTGFDGVPTKPGTPTLVRRVCPLPPDEQTLARAGQDLDRKLRQRFGDRGPTEFELEDLRDEPWSRLEQYAHIHRNMEQLASSLGRSLDDLRTQMRNELRTALEGQPVVIRVPTERDLISILREGRYKPVWNDRWREHDENQWFGREFAAGRSPIYGSVAVGGVRPAGPLLNGSGPDFLTREYGPYQLYLTPDVRERTAFVVGDSGVHKPYAIPSPLTDPLEWSYHARAQSADPVLSGVGRDYDGQPFRSRQHVEALVLGDVTRSNFDLVALPHEPGPQLRGALRGAGVDWRVVTNETIAREGTPLERAAALRRTTEDLKWAREGAGSAVSADSRNAYLSLERILRADHDRLLAAPTA